MLLRVQLDQGSIPEFLIIITHQLLSSYREEEEEEEEEESVGWYKRFVVIGDCLQPEQAGL